MTKAVPLFLSALALGAGACADNAPGDDSGSDHMHSDRGGIGVVQQAIVPTALDIRRSLAVTDQVITSTFTLDSVLSQLAAQSAVPGLTGQRLFAQLWDTQNSAATGVTTGPHCDDNGGTLNGFPYQCRPSEGAQALNPATEITRYSLIGLFNRFDLASARGEDCGEHRLVFGRTSGGGRAFIIFEAVLPNPTPSLGLEGCRPVANFWAGLTSNGDPASRAALLHDFYFNGLPGFSPVIHIDNYGNLGVPHPTGQVRINEFISPPWMLREFKLQKLSATTMQFTPVTVKTNPFGDLFSPTSASPQTAAFQNTFLPSAVAGLAVNDINLFNYAVPDSFNSGQSNSQNFGGTDDFSARFNPASALAVNIQTQLTAIGSLLTPANIVARAGALSCGGCHQLSNGATLGGGLPSWPSSAGFVHSTEFTEAGPDGTRFRLSAALTGTFLPHRAQVLQNFLNRRPSASDYDGDRRADLSIFRSGPYTFNIASSTTNYTSVTTRVWGAAGDIPVGSSDYDGDGRSDMTYFRPSDGSWHILTSSSGYSTSIVLNWGTSGDAPVPGGDYDGDGTADIAVFRPSEGNWYVLTSSSGFTASTVTKWGSSVDRPLAGADFDGDGKDDLVVYRRGPKTMNVMLSSTGALLQRTIGASGDIPVAGADFDGDGRADMAVWNASTGQWTVRTSSSNWQLLLQVNWGTSGDVPLAGTDFDGDGRADFVVYRPSEGNWYALLSTTNYTGSLVKKFGNSTDLPLSR
jgi:hypothetical protein